MVGASDSATPSTGGMATGAGDGTSTTAGGSGLGSTSGDPDTTEGVSASATTGDPTTGDPTTGEPPGTGGAQVCGNRITEPGEFCDDGNDDDLDGCLSDCRQGPTGIDYGSQTPLTQQGNANGGDAFDDECPSGEVLIGIRGATGGWLHQIRGVCGVLALVDPGAIALSVTESSLMPIRGQLGGQAYDATCPAGSAVVGFDGRAGSLVDQIELRCAPLFLADDGVDLSIGFGGPNDLAPVGGNGGQPFPQADCPAGEVATIANIRAGDSIDAFGVTCRPVSLDF